MRLVARLLAKRSESTESREWSARLWTPELEDLP
jgi:hypothetical protein